jgi:hypothetical protein
MLFFTDLIDEVHENQHKVESDVTYDLGLKLTWCRAALNYFGNYICFVYNLPKPEPLSDEHLYDKKSVVAFLGTTCFNQLVYSDRVFRFGDWNSGLLLCRNALEDFLLLRYFHEVRPDRIREWRRGEITLLPKTIRNALPERDDIRRLYGLLCLFTHSNPEKINQLFLLSVRQKSLFLGGHAQDPELLGSFYDILIDVAYTSCFTVHRWYRQYLPFFDSLEQRELSSYYSDFLTQTHVKHPGYYDRLLNQARKRAKPKS